MPNHYTGMIKAVTGVVIGDIGLLLSLISIVGLLGTSILTFIIPQSIIIGIPLLLLLIIGIIMFVFGLKMYFDNAGAVARLALGVTGIFFILLGLVTLLGGGASGVGTFAGLFMLGVGAGFIHVGFNLRIIPYVNEVIKSTGSIIKKI